MTKPKLLLISAIAPFPTTSGGANRIYHTLKNLGSQFELYLIFFASPDYVFTTQEKKFLNQHCHWWQTFAPGYKQSLSYLSFSQPYWFGDWFNLELAFCLPQIINTYQIPLIQIEFSQLLYLKQFIPPAGRTIFVAHDISSLSFTRQLQETKNLFRQFVFFFRALGVTLYEKKYLPQFDLVVAMSPTDAQILQHKFATKKTLLAPNGIPEIKILPSPKIPPLNLGFIGPFSHTPNLHAVKYFITKIAPLLEKAQLDYRYYLAGKNDPDLINSWLRKAHLRHPHAIINLGFVSNLEDFYRYLHVLIVTLHSGSGTRLKILEALSFGKTVISTPLGAEGIDIPPPQLQLATTPQEFLHAITTLLKNQKNHYNTKPLEKYLWSNIFHHYHHQVSPTTTYE